MSITADEETGLIGSAAAPAAVFSSGTGRKSRPMRGGAISGGDEIIQARAASPSPLCIDLSAEQLSALQAAAARHGHASAADFARSLLLPHLQLPGSGA